MKRCWNLFSQDKKTRRRQYRTLAGVVCAGAALLAALWLIGPPLLRLFDEPEKFRAWVDGKGIGGQLAFVGMVVVQIIVAMIPGEPLEIAAGYAFGAVEGTILCVLGTAIGSTLVFWFVRLVGMRAVEVFFSRRQIERLPFFSQPPTNPPLSLIRSRSSLGIRGYSPAVSGVRTVCWSRSHRASKVTSLFDQIFAMRLFP